MNHHPVKLFAVICCLWLASPFGLFAEPTLESGWENPPNEARLRAYWWWLNGNVTKASITRDLEQMQAKGFGGALLCDANGASQDGNDTVPPGPTFFSPEWRELYKHTLREADRLGLNISLNIQSGWNLGGPVVTKDDAAKKYVWSELKISGGTNVVVKLPEPKARENFYRDSAVVAYRVKNSTAHPPLKNWKQKALQESLQPFSAPDSSPLFAEIPATPGEQDADVGDVIDLSAQLGATGILNWAAPAGDWQVLRFGSTIGDHAYVSTSSEGWRGYALDVYSATAFQNYWDKIVEPLITDAESVARENSALRPPHSALRYLHTDSWEVELANWTPTLRAEFQKRRGYDLLPWLPVLAGRIVNSRDASDRFLNDYRRTLGDLAIDGHFKIFRDRAHAHGLLIHPESGGPHAVPIDAQQCLGMDDAPMSEFWAWSWTHRIGDANRFFVKQPASAAHTYGHKLVLAEGFTTIGPHWQEKLWDNLKPSFDKALCEGLNGLVWHAFVCSPESEGIPGQQYFAGTHLNPNVTWWEKSAPFFSYLNRCQWLMQQGNFNADVLYFYGDHVPNFTQHKRTNPAHVGNGYDYDVITAEALLARASVKDGKIVLPDGMSYRLLVLPERDQISLPVLEKVSELVKHGARVIGPKPVHSESFKDSAQADAAVKKIADELWDGSGPSHVITGKTEQKALLDDGVFPDFEFWGEMKTDIDFIHRTSADAEIYFIANRSTNAIAGVCNLRVAGKAPERWNPVTGEHCNVTAYSDPSGQLTMVPLEFGPCESCFIIFRQPTRLPSASSIGNVLTEFNSRKFKVVREISGAWTVHFDPKWGGPESAQFDSLVSWPTRTEPGIKFYSGTATYEKTFDVASSQFTNHSSRIMLDLGSVRELAEVKVNGKSCGIVWCPPFRVDVTGALKFGENKLEVEVVNFWPNRIIGDASLPKEQRLTRTNIRKLTAKTPLEDAGLFGPVRLMVEQR